MSAFPARPEVRPRHSSCVLLRGDLAALLPLEHVTPQRSLRSATADTVALPDLSAPPACPRATPAGPGLGDEMSAVSRSARHDLPHLVRVAAMTDATSRSALMFSGSPRC